MRFTCQKSLILKNRTMSKRFNQSCSDSYLPSSTKTSFTRLSVGESDISSTSGNSDRYVEKNGLKTIPRTKITYFSDDEPSRPFQPSPPSELPESPETIEASLPLQPPDSSEASEALQSIVDIIKLMKPTLTMEIVGQPETGEGDSATKQSTENVKPIKIPSASLIRLGQDTSNTSNWDYNEQSPKDGLYDLLKDMIVKRQNTDVQVQVGEEIFKCHMTVLQCYSELFRDVKEEVLVVLPETRVTPKAFRLIYDWMLDDRGTVKRDGIIEVFKAAKFLRIIKLQQQCWACLDNAKIFYEPAAFLLYLEAREHGMQEVQDLMLTRICRFFLQLVASKEFLELSFKEVSKLFNLTSIGVNSEMEMFMCAVRWLNYDWDERQKYTGDLMKTIRFSLMPPLYLITLKDPSGSVAVDRCLENSSVKKNIKEGMSFNTYITYSAAYMDKKKEDRADGAKIKPRARVYDPNCEYHERASSASSILVTFEALERYLVSIQEAGKDYWTGIQLLDTDNSKSKT